MSDMFKNIRLEIGRDQKADGQPLWLYRNGEAVHGPLPQAELANKIIAGTVPLTVSVAREGGEFSPLVQANAFTKAIKLAQGVQARKIRKKRRNIQLLFISPLMILFLVLGADLGRAIQSRAVKVRAAQKQIDATPWAKTRVQKRFAAQTPLALVPLVGAQRSSVRGTSSARSRTQTTTQQQLSGNSAQVSSCQRQQQAVLGGLSRYVRQINACVQDEKSRDTQGLLPPSLILDFVITTEGRVVQFSVDNRHYRRGPLNNCLTKVFRTVRYPRAGGSTCPVRLPVKI